MGITIIKDYKMPHNCYDCELHNYHECDLTCESIEEDYCWNGDNREKHCPLREVEAIPKAEYEARLMADTLAVLEKIADEINKRIQAIPCSADSSDIGVKVGYMYSLSLIRANINALKENEDGNDN